MKKIALAVAIIAVAATAAFAGGLESPVMEAAPMVEETAASSAGGFILPLLLLLLVAFAFSGSSSPAPAQQTVAVVAAG